MFRDFDDDNSLNEARKEDDMYFQGAFWIKGDSIKDIARGNFEIIGNTLLSDYNGNSEEADKIGRRNLTHKKLWPTYAKELSDKPFNYLPRGRVAIFDGTAYIFLHSFFNQPKVIDAVIRKYHLEKMNYELEFNDVEQGDHYDFLLR